MLRNRLDVAVLVGGVIAMFAIPMALAGGEFFWPPASVVAGYLLMVIVCFVRRREDARFSLIASGVLAFATFASYARAYFNWNSLGLILDYEMPVTVLGISLPACLILVTRRLRSIRRSGPGESVVRPRDV